MKELLRMENVVDLDAGDGTSASKFKAPGAGYVYPASCFLRFEEAVAAGGFTTTAGVASLEVGGVEVATWSTGVASTARAIGDTVMVTPAAAYTELPIKVASGDLIECKTKTQGVGGTVTGTVRFWVVADFNIG